MRRVPEVGAKLRESGFPTDAEERVPSSGPIASVGDLAAAVAHDLNNPLAVVVANLEFLRELCSQMRAAPGEQGATFLSAPETKAWVSARLDDAEASLADAAQAAERIRRVVEHMKRHTLPPSAGPLGAPRKKSAPGRARVLVVDDDAMVARALRRALRAHEVVVANSPHEALERLEQGERFDVILCDLMMPEIPGSDLHARVKRFAPEQAEQMIFITGGATTREAAAFLASVPDRVIHKPFNVDELRDLVARRSG